MQIEYVTGDLLKTEEKIILHGVNARGRMNSGVARQIREQLPYVYHCYLQMHSLRQLKLGSAPWIPSNGIHVINAVIQDDDGTQDGTVERDSHVRYADYEAIRSCIRSVNATVRANPILGKVRIAMPKIGAGLANGDWRVIKEIIEEEATLFQPVVYVYDPANLQGAGQ